ncbi:hypothetical protein RJ641_017506 [Dillenia turbinata]|uniref:Chitinase n=1 Tax=Dillenia turbinata TaxID=194707 RepID=A0AAN8UTX4_9MAGN
MTKRKRWQQPASKLLGVFSNHGVPVQCYSRKAIVWMVFRCPQLEKESISDHVFSKPTSINAWDRNAIYSIVEIVRKFNLDGIDIDNEHFKSGSDTFAE